MIYSSAGQAFLERQKDGTFPTVVYEARAEFYDSYRILGYTPDNYAASQLPVERGELRVVTPIRK